MQKITLKEATLYTAIITVCILLDQLTKWLAVKLLMPIDTFPIIENALHLTYHENRGMAFGMLADRRWIFMSISTVLIVGLLLYLYLGFAKSSTLSAVAVAMITAGGIGNMIDRVLLGYVVDFIDFRLINFAIFNGADSFVCVGAGLLVLALILESIKEARGGQVK